MDHVQDLLKTAVAEIERILSSKTVVGEPMTVGDTTLIPLVSVGFGFGAGGGTGPAPGAKERAEGSGAGTGGGGGIKPVAVIIVDAHGARLEPIRGGASSVLEKVAEAVSQGIQRSGKGEAS